MLIDWFTVIAQAINFLILLWLLKRFLFKPILKAIDEREKKIRTQIQEAEIKMEEAEEEQKKFHRKNKDLEEKQESLLISAVEKASKKHKQLLDEARGEAEELRSQLELSIREEQQNLSREITERTQREVIAIARKVMADLGSASLEEQVTQVFIRRIKELKSEKRDQLVDALNRSSGKVIVRSAFGLSLKQQEEIEKAIMEITIDDIQCQFDISSENISGIELKVHGYKIAWSVADYLSSLEKKLAELLNEEPELQSTTNPASNEPTA